MQRSCKNESVDANGEADALYIAATAENLFLCSELRTADLKAVFGIVSESTFDGSAYFVTVGEASNHLSSQINEFGTYVSTRTEDFNPELGELAVTPCLRRFVAPTARHIPQPDVASASVPATRQRLKGRRSFRSQTEFTSSAIWEDIHLSENFRPRFLGINSSGFEARENHFFEPSLLGELSQTSDDITATASLSSEEQSGTLS